MKSLKYLALLSVLMVPLTFAQAQVRVGVGIGPVGVGVGVGPGYVGAAPVCEWGYYPDYPYACAPYGYYGPEWFSGGLFIGAGPWYHGGWGRGYYGRAGYYGHGFAGRGYAGRGFEGRGPALVARGGSSFHGSAARGGGSFHGGGSRGGRR